MKLSTIFAYAVIYCANVEAANLRRFLDDIDNGSNDFLGDSTDASAADRFLQEFDTSIDGSSVNGDRPNSGLVDVSDDGSTFRLLKEKAGVDSLEESISDSDDDADSVYQPGTVKPASFDASGSFDESGVLWWK
ncbi:hypothetical protein P3T76_006215 [Phytophthora citrophthora]|uniref:Uncharacterized protein n=1 Tax=Phytophthora citrophthora TaxID=4793 RepID=A0AAD9GQP7_9STRA|nr:hypothetical protein P3T76_006215 [Phytophthora citrophthora]